MRTEAQLKKHRIWNRKWKEANPEKNKASHMVSNWREHGIDMTFERYEQMVEDQQGRCAICKRHRSEFKQNLSVDHNHETGKVRGLLCAACNRGIGLMGDSADMMRAGADYLEKE